jgi:hypothetical protein
VTDEREDYADPGPPVVSLPPARWLSFGFGLALPYAAVVGGWAVADAVAWKGSDAVWWDEARSWVYGAVAVAIVVGALLCWPLLRRAQQPHQKFFATVAFMTYAVLLVLVNLAAYMKTSGPFP